MNGILEPARAVHTRPMRPNLAEMQIAVRVLQAIVDRSEPDSLDIEFLRRVMPNLAAAPVDELACEIVHRELQRTRIPDAA